MHKNLSFFAFTATPKGKTLQLFGQKDAEGIYRPFHIYSMRQAIEEHFILDVLQNYMTYKMYYKIAKIIEDNPEFDTTAGSKAIINYETLHPHNISQKTAIMLEHFMNVTRHKIGGRAKAMVVTPSRLHAVRYVQEFKRQIKEKGLNQEYESIRDMLLNHLHERRYNKQLTYSNYYVMNKLRVMFARISVSMLEPDLVIMDEFQRFKFLLSSDDSELGILAHSFLSGHDTRVLLLSATPYKLYSTLEEIDENQLDEHYAEFFQVMNFLFDDEVKDIKFKEVWKNYSHALSELKAGDSAIIRMKELAENAMYQGVSRTERISVMDSGDYTDDSSVKHHLQIDENDINSYIQMSRLLSKTDSNHSLPVDYAKSCPYLMSFMKKYKIKEQIEKYYIKHPDEFGSEREQCLLWLNRNKINKYDELPKTNARLEALKEKAFTGGAEKYLWIPPSLPYYEMQGAYKNSKGFSKILVFSAWEMVPRMIGALVSYEAERLTVGKLVHQIKNQDKKNTGYFAEGSRRYPVARLRFNVSNGEVRGMSLFALLYPSKTLSDMYLPIAGVNSYH